MADIMRASSSPSGIWVFLAFRGSGLNKHGAWLDDFVESLLLCERSLEGVPWVLEGSVLRELSSRPTHLSALYFLRQSPPFAVHQSLLQLAGVHEPRYPAVREEAEDLKREWGNTKHRPVQAAIGEEAFIALRSYCGNGYYDDINWMLRGGLVKEADGVRWREVAADLLPRVWPLDSAIAQAARVTRAGACWAYRGISHIKDEAFATGDVPFFE
jgi:hypothetical protein